MSAVSFEEECKRVTEEVWSLVDIEGSLVLDFGVGESTRELTKRGAHVIGVELDLNKLRNCELSCLGLVGGDVCNPPFRRGAVDLAVFYFTLHEVNPSLHEKAVSAVRPLVRKVMIVEPSPEGCPAYRRYARLWRDAMRSIGRFEEYRPAKYWESLLTRCGFRVVVSKTIAWRVRIPPTVLERLVLSIVREWEKLSVDRRYIEEMREFLNYAREYGMKWSDLIVVIGEAP